MPWCGCTQPYPFTVQFHASVHGCVGEFVEMGVGCVGRECAMNAMVAKGMHNMLSLQVQGADALVLIVAIPSCEGKFQKHQQ